MMISLFPACRGFLALLGGMLLLLASARPGHAQGPTPAWVAHYQAANNSSDIPTALATDAQGNVYVSGASTDSAGNYSSVTIKYDAQGHPLWTAPYSAPSTYTNVIFLSLDAQNNVYVASSVETIVFSIDLVTVKYDTNGNLLWANRRIGGGQGAMVRMDAQGNQYVFTSTGFSANSTYSLAKYDADGNQVWSTSHQGGQEDPYTLSMTIDSQGNVYTTGSVGGYESGNSLIYSHFVTTKYDRYGNQAWVKRYQGDDYYSCASNAIAVDSQGNVYITGAADTFYRHPNGDAVTIKYDAQGNQLWAARYHSRNNLKFGGVALALDAQSNVYVSGNYGPAFPSGQGSFLLKYDFNGALIWENSTDGTNISALKVDATGDLYTLQPAYRSFNNIPGPPATVTKYDANGNSEWSASYQGTGGVVDILNVLTVDAQGNAYLTGAESPGSSSSSSGFVTVKYPPSQTAVSDITSQVSVTRSGLRYVRATGLWAQTITVSNRSSGSAAGSLYLVLDGLNAGVTLSNRAGVTTSAAPLNSPYLSSALTSIGNHDQAFDPGESVTFTLQFADPSGAALTYTPRILAGSGTP